MKTRLLGATLAVVAAMVVSVIAVLAQGPKPQAPSVATGGGFVYQGQLRKDGVPVDGFCDFTFSLWDAASAGSLFGVGQLVSAVTVTHGLFSVNLNNIGQFGPEAFTGDGRWLQADVQCGADLIATTLSRQRVAPAPIALTLSPGAVVSNTAIDALTVRSTFANGNGLRAAADQGTNGWGVVATGSGVGVYGTSPGGTGVRGRGEGTGGTGVEAAGSDNNVAPNIALRIVGGAIQVNEGNVTPAFTFQVSVVSGGCASLSHPLLNSKPTAMIFVTPRHDTPTAPATDVKVVYNTGFWNLCSPSLATGMRYNMLIINQ